MVQVDDDVPRAVAKAARQGRTLICILAPDQVVRGLAPILASGAEVPAVILVDESGKYVVNLLGAKGAVLRQVALALQATVVLGTPPESLRVPDVRLIGRRRGWKMEEAQNLERVSAVVRQGQPVGIYQDAGHADWWQPFGSWPHHFERISGWHELDACQALLAISDRVLPPLPARLREHSILYRPPTLALGVACRRGLTATELTDCVAELFAEHRLSLQSLTAIAVPASHREEPGLVEFADERELPLLAYPADKLALTAPQGTTAAGACEPAAMLAAGVLELVVPKVVFRHVALAVARRPTG